MYPVPLKTISVCSRAHRQIWVSFLFSSFRLTLSRLFCFITVIWTMCVSLLCYEDAVGDPMRTESMFVTWSCSRIKG